MILELEKSDKKLLQLIRSDELACGAINRIDDMLDKSDKDDVVREDICHLYMGAFRSALSIYCADKEPQIPNINRTTRSIGNYLADTYISSRMQEK